MSARPPATREVFELLGGLSIYGRIASPQGSATKANPAKAGDAKLRGYRTPFACHASRAAEPLREGSFMRSRTPLLYILWLLTAVAACDLRPRSSTGVNDPVTRVVVSPDSTMLDPSQSYQFGVYGRTQV